MLRTGTETTHVKILQSILEKQTKSAGKHISKFEKQHRSVGSNAIRAAVLGGNDGLVSNGIGKLIGVSVT